MCCPLALWLSILSALCVIVYYHAFFCCCFSGIFSLALSCLHCHLFRHVPCPLAHSASLIHSLFAPWHFLQRWFVPSVLLSAVLSPLPPGRTCAAASHVLSLLVAEGWQLRVTSHRLALCMIPSFIVCHSWAVNSEQKTRFTAIIYVRSCVISIEFYFGCNVSSQGYLFTFLWFH